VADTVNDVADRKTLSESTLGATQDGAHAATEPIDPTRAKVKDGSHEVDWDAVKQKATQILQSFGNETADTFDTVQDRNIVAESVRASPVVGKDPVTESVQRMVDEAPRVVEESREDSASGEPVHSSGLTWDSLKQKATSVLDSIQSASHNAAESAHEQAGKGGNDNNASAMEAAMRKAADVAGVASDRASVDFKPDEPVFTSETRRATAGQVADYAAK
jgi:hypothetical protein